MQRGDGAGKLSSRGKSWNQWACSGPSFLPPLILMRWASYRRAGPLHQRTNQRTAQEMEKQLERATLRRWACRQEATLRSLKSGYTSPSMCKTQYSCRYAYVFHISYKIPPVTFSTENVQRKNFGEMGFCLAKLPHDKATICTLGSCTVHTAQPAWGHLVKQSHFHLGGSCGEEVPDNVRDYHGGAKFIQSSW